MCMFFLNFSHTDDGLMYKPKRFCIYVYVHSVTGHPGSGIHPGSEKVVR